MKRNLLIATAITIAFLMPTTIFAQGGGVDRVIPDPVFRPSHGPVRQPQTLPGDISIGFEANWNDSLIEPVQWAQRLEKKLGPGYSIVLSDYDKASWKLKFEDRNGATGNNWDGTRELISNVAWVGVRAAQRWTRWEILDVLFQQAADELLYKYGLKKYQSRIGMLHVYARLESPGRRPIILARTLVIVEAYNEHKQWYEYWIIGDGPDEAQPCVTDEQFIGYGEPRRALLYWYIAEVQLRIHTLIKNPQFVWSATDSPSCKNPRDLGKPEYHPGPRVPKIPIPRLPW